ncbi:tyrosine-type recombinase/integrase [Synechocystis sp. PCC 7509]|uniref:tyrosine-type recombinase/integrase n=1 Tax=Synechocystis sp. PCC 7509 TaxID=927677 RepID=UPI0002ABC9DD|nr:tyrosine-type recombinase/integrase [Synechocystis sp. PCC 7509]
MIEVNWKKDYQDDFNCPRCNHSKMKHAGFRNGIKQFSCIKCRQGTIVSITLNQRSKFLNFASKPRHETIDWEKNYNQGKFICPSCKSLGVSLEKKTKHKKNQWKFYCQACPKTYPVSCHIDIRAIADPINQGVIWHTSHKIKNFVCSKCQAENIYFVTLDYEKNGKKLFQCRTCKSIIKDSIDLTLNNIRRWSGRHTPVKTFNWSEDQWDLRSINPEFNPLDLKYSTINFTAIQPDWFKQEVKKYIQHVSKTGNAFGTVAQYLISLRSFSVYLNQKKISGFQQINRSLILDYLIQEKTAIKSRLGTLRSFFTAGTVRGWFNIDPDIIRAEDYPKQHIKNPDPLSDTVRKQIEQNLSKLPDPLARMWIICYFTAMRVSELALLRRDCLVQEGQQWKLVWHRKKTNDYHEVPISRTIAKVVQEQQEYIQNLWEENWDYLFCHYHGLFMADLSQLKLEPVKRIIPTASKHPLIAGIRCLIQTLDLRDENGKRAEFTAKILRPTRLTQLFEQGHDLSVVSAWAGHKHFATTSTYYTFVSCELIEREAGHIQKALVNSDGHHLPYESLPKSFWKTPTPHKLELSGTHINTPIYGFCGLPLEQDCHKFRACYTCSSFVAVPEKLPQYILTRDELRAKQSNALDCGQEVLVEQFGRQADQLDKIIAGLQEAA